MTYPNQDPNHEQSFLGDMDTFFDNNQPAHVIAPTSTKQAQNANIEKFYQKLSELGLNLEELRPILESNDNTLVLSGAGAGKTTALTLKILYDLLNGTLMKLSTVQSSYGVTHVQVPAKILVSTFLKTGTLDLKASLREWAEKLGITGIDFSSIQFKTIHAEVKDAITKMGAQVTILEDTQPLVKSVALKLGVRSVTATTRSISQDEVRELQSLMSFARNRLDEKRYEHQLLDSYGFNNLLLDVFLKDFKLFREATGQMDFEDMQEMLLQYAKTNPNVAQFIFDRYDYVFIDEAQDTSQLQYELLKYYFQGAKRTVIFGDPNQSIYGFRGSDKEIIARRYREDFNPTILNLSTNYRCRSNILNTVKPSIMLNGDPSTELLKSHHEGGEVNVRYDADVNDLVRTMKQHLVRNNTVGVLARTNADLLIPALILELDGNINFTVSKSVNLSGRMFKQIIGMLDLITKRVSSDHESLFKQFLRRYDWHEAENLYNVLVANRSMTIYNIPEEDLQHSVPNLYNGVLKGLRQAYEVNQVTAFLYLLGVLEQKVYTGASSYATKAREMAYFLKKLVMEHETLKNLSLLEIDILFRSTLPERLSNRARYGTDATVKLTTVHEAKGKEWDSVFIWNDTEGSFPKKVGSRDLTQDELEEERRVHYIALTRAKHILTIYTSVNNMGTFLKECDLSFANVTNNQPLNSTTENHGMEVHRRQSGTDNPNHPINRDTLQEARRVTLNYISELRIKGGIADDNVANMEIVLSALGEKEVIRICHDEYGIGTQHEDPYQLTQTFENIFRTHADTIMLNGSYQA